jgi:hypothetical protein
MLGPRTFAVELALAVTVPNYQSLSQLWYDIFAATDIRLASGKGADAGGASWKRCKCIFCKTHPTASAAALALAQRYKCILRKEIMTGSRNIFFYPKIMGDGQGTYLPKDVV